MQIDFHQAKSAPVSRRSTVRAFVLPLMVKRVIGLVVAFVGLCLILVSLLSFLTPRSATPYAMLFFSHMDPSKPQAPVTIIWIDETKSSVSVTALPDAVEFHSQSLGTYPLASIYAAHLATKESDADFITDVSFYFRFPIKGYLYADKQVRPTKMQLVRFAFNACFMRPQTSLRFGQCVHLLCFLSAFSTNIRTLEFPKNATGPGKVDTLLSLNRGSYREWSQSHFSESFKLWNRYTVAVLNGTQTSGLATTAANILEDFGLSILYVGDATVQMPAGKIAISPKVQSQPQLVDLLQTTLRLPSQVDEDLTQRYRSDIVVLIGEKEQKFFAP